MTAAGRAGAGGLDLTALERELAGASGPAGLHPVGLRQVLEGDSTVGQLGAAVTRYCPPGTKIVVLAAETPILAAGQDLRHAIESDLGGRYAVRWCVSGAGQPLHADEPTVGTATAALADAGCVITVGSGTITDIGKAAAHAAAAGGPAVPLICVQTATSVNGYADPFSVLLRAGVKRTTATRWPDALIVGTDVLAAAPADLNRAGVGDMMAMFTATADWYLASVLGNPAAVPGADPLWNAAIAGLTRSRSAELLAVAAQTSAPASLAGLARILTLSGIGMGVAGSTAPASGMEHAISHLLEMATTAGGDSAAFHGTQVGVASVVAAATWSHVRQRMRTGALHRPACLPDPDATRRRIEHAFARLDPAGAMAAECFADYGRKIRRLTAGGDPLARLRASWPRFERELDTLLISPGDLAAALRAAGLPVSFGELAGASRPAARWAVEHCALQRQRVSVADLAMLLGAWQDADIDAVLEQSGTLGRTP